MPLFDYRCRHCGETHTDVLVTNYHQAAPFAMSCSVCGRIGALERLPSRPSFQIRGYSAKNGYTTPSSDTLIPPKER